MATRFLQFAGKLVGVVILLVCAMGLFVLLFATVGCTHPAPTNTYLVRTVNGNFCVDANTYDVGTTCTNFYVWDGESELGMLVATHCGNLSVTRTTPDNCRSARPILPPGYSLPEMPTR